MKPDEQIISYFYGLPNPGAEGYFAAKNYLQKGKSIIYLTTDIPEDFARSVEQFAPRDTQVIVFPEILHGQAAVLHQLLQKPSLFALAVPYAIWNNPLPSPDLFQKSTFTVRRGQNLRRTELLEFLSQNGYLREGKQFCHFRKNWIQLKKPCFKSIVHRFAV